VDLGQQVGIICLYITISGVIRYNLVIKYHFKLLAYHKSVIQFIYTKKDISYIRGMIMVKEIKKVSPREQFKRIESGAYKMKEPAWMNEKPKKPKYAKKRHE